MSTNIETVELAGSHRQPLPGATVVGRVSDNEPIEVTIVLRRRADRDGHAALDALLEHQPGRPFLSHEELATAHGADPRDVAEVLDFAGQHQLWVIANDPARRIVRLAGTADRWSRALGVELQQWEHAQGTYRGRTGPLHIPAALQEIVVAVLGLDNRPQARPHFQVARAPQGLSPRQAGSASFRPDQVAALYNFPAQTDGSGQCIGLIELGGGYRPADLQAYCRTLPFGGAMPAVKAISVDGGQNAPTGDPQGPDGEVMLDIEVLAAVTPKAGLAVYFAPNTDQGFHDALTYAIHDQHNRPSVISISWGGPEDSWTGQALQAFNAALQDAAAMGISVCCSAGDNGSGDGVGDGLAHVDFPASSPYALACGGTRLIAAGSAISAETVWCDDPNASATGGGVSDRFALPAYQQNAGVGPSANPGAGPGRGVPDVAGNADPATGYRVRVDGVDMVIGGTSAVAPLWAGLLARINQLHGRPVGFVNPQIYGPLNRPQAFRDVTSGRNGAYRAGPGWDACTGWGSPRGTALAAALSPPAAG